MGEQEVDPLVEKYQEGLSWVKRILGGEPRNLREFFTASDGVMCTSDVMHYAGWSKWTPSQEQVGVERFLHHTMTVDSPLENHTKGREELFASTQFSHMALKYALFHPATKDSPLLHSIHRAIIALGDDVISEFGWDGDDSTARILSPLMSQIHPDHFPALADERSYHSGAFSLAPMSSSVHYYRCERPLSSPRRMVSTTWDEARSEESCAFLGGVEFPAPLSLSDDHLCRVIQMGEKRIEVYGTSTAWIYEDASTAPISAYYSAIPPEERTTARDNLGQKGFSLLRSALERNNIEMNSFLDRTVSSNIFALTPRKMSEFLSLVEEYNLEWAMAAYDWGESYHGLDSDKEIHRDEREEQTP